MQLWREQEPDADLVDAESDLFRAELEVDAERLQDIGAAALARYRAVAMLGDGKTGPGSDECNRR